MFSRKTIVLYAPHFVSASLREGANYRAVPPISHLALAGPLRDAGYRVVILDAKWDLDWRKRLSELKEELLMAGVTALTGPSVSDGLEFSSYVKSLVPDVPVVWGGWHATYAARQAVQDPRVDIVVRDMGERTIVEIARAIETGGALRDIAGIHYRTADRIEATPDRPAEDINAFPPPAYDLIDPQRYIVATPDGGRLAISIFSRGCPYACDFCMDSRKRVLALGIERMIEDIEFWLARGADRMQFFDGNFFLARKRLMDFSDAVIARGLHQRFRWTATAVGRRIAGMDDELLARLKQAGLSQVAIGAESGSDELLARITNKTTRETTREAVLRLSRHGIGAYLWFLVGYPDEPADALEDTFGFILELKKAHPDLTLFLNFATPLPGSEVYRIAVDRGLVKAPQTFEDWARFDFLQSNLIGVDREYERRVKRFRQYLNLAYPVSSMLRAPALVRRLASWRLENRNFRFPVEVAVVRGLRLGLTPVGG